MLRSATPQHIRKYRHTFKKCDTDRLDGRVGDFQPNLAWCFRLNEATPCAHCGYMVMVLYHINYSGAKLSGVYHQDDE